jgi:hypothetical protein
MTCRLLDRRGPLRPRPTGKLICVLAIAAALLLLVDSPSRAEEMQPAAALHERIDRLIELDHVGTPAPLAGDAEFLRRIYLDLTGNIPSIEETRQFLADTSPAKRAELINRLLTDPRFDRHMANLFDLALMERRAEKHVKNAEWQPYLVESFRANKPLDQLAREILSADGVDPKQRAAARFYLDRDAEPNLLTRDVGRVFFGMDLQCAQCHNHPLIDDYLQSDYYGIYAFLSRSFVFADKKEKKSFLAEKAEGDVTFKSVFTEESGSTSPRLPGGQPIVDPSFAKGEEYLVKPDKDVRPIPKYSRRAQLAEHAASGLNQAFNRNWANRLWAQMMGRGLVHPVDLHHAANPPAHPELLQLLADELVAMKFDVREFLRQLALSRTYQRGFDLPTNLAEQAAGARDQVATLTEAHERRVGEAEVARQAYVQAQQDRGAAAEAVEELAKPMQEAATALNTAKAQHKTLSDQLAQTKAQLQAKQEVASAVAQIADKTALAATRLAGNDELSALVATLQARGEQMAKELQAMAATMGTQQTATDAAAVALADAQKQHDALAPGHAAATQQLVQRQAALEAARVASSATAVQVELAQRRVEQAGRLVSLNEQVAAAAMAKSQLEALFAQLQPLDQQLAPLTADMTLQTAALAEARKGQDALSKTLAEQTEARERSLQAVALIGDLVAKTVAASDKFGGAAELQAIQAEVERRLQLCKTEAESLQQQVAASQVELDAQSSKVDELDKLVEAVSAQVAALNQQVAPLRKQHEEVLAQHDAASAGRDELLTALTDDWGRRFVAASLKPLRPEQLAWSVMEAAGVVERYRVAARAELHKKQPLTEPVDAAALAERQKLLENEVHGKLAGQVNAFVQLFGTGAGQPQDDFFATVDQALFFANGGQVLGWLAPSAGNVTDRLNKLESPEAIAEELYLSVLVRRPVQQEVQDVAEQLKARADEKPAVVQELVWALLTSAEFRFNH